jgi:hypothetical protein
MLERGQVLDCCCHHIVSLSFTTWRLDDPGQIRTITLFSPDTAAYAALLYGDEY